MPRRARSQPQPDPVSTRKPRADVPRDDPRRARWAGRVPDPALAAMLGQTDAAVRAWRVSRGLPVFRGARVPDDLWGDFAAVADAAGADVARWAPAAALALTPPTTPIAWGGGDWTSDD